MLRFAGQVGLSIAVGLIAGAMAQAQKPALPPPVLPSPPVLQKPGLPSLVGQKPASPLDAQPVAQFEVRLPADAQLEVSGQKSKLSGPVRKFQSPPLAGGKEYVYTLKATWQGKQITKELVVKAGSSATVDLGPEFAAAGKGTEKKGSFALNPPAPLRVMAGEDTELTFRIKREHFNDPVELIFEGEPKGISITDVTIPGKKEEAVVAISVGSEAPAGIAAIKVRALAGARKEAVLTLIVDRPLSAGASFEFEPIPPMTLKAGEDKDFKIKLKRDQFDGPVEITFEHVPKGVTITQTTIADNEAEVAVSANKDAEKGAASIKVRGTSGKLMKDTSFELTVQ